MITSNVKSTVKVQVQAAPQKTTRLFYIDYLRAGLAALVVVHHVALVYGATVEGFYYLEPPFTDPLAYLALMVFVLVNQGWFMGAFFLLAGLFAPGSIDRKGASAFVRSRLVRLGIPLLLFYFVLNPIARVGWWLMPSELTGITTPLTWKAYPGMVGIGPLWFVAMLLIFSFGYAGWRWLTRNRETTSANRSSGLTYLGIGLFALGLAGASYLMRMVVPLGKSVWEFPTLAYLPQYLSLYVIGIVAARNNWLQKLTGRMGIVGLVAAVTALVFLFPLAFSGQWFSLALTPAIDNAMGNGHWQSAVYALWDSIFAVGLVLGLIPLFRRFFNGNSPAGRLLSQNSYAVYILHIPILVYAVYLLRGVALAPLLKFGLACLIVVPACFIAAATTRRLPGVRQVL